MIRFFASILFFLFFSFYTASAEQARGIWVECEGTNETLSTPQKLAEMIRLSKDTGINTIFLQVHRHNRSWFNSSFADPAPFLNAHKKYNLDPLGYTITEAHKQGIKVHAWINLYRIGKNLDVHIIKKLGRNVVTRDGHGRSLLEYPVNKLPDGGYWLDPGDMSVQKYILDMVGEILKKYPLLDGIHLDFIRYPYVELTPGSQFSERKDFGYGRSSVERFKVKYGYSPLEMDLNNRERTQKWDDWRRRQITNLVNGIYKQIKKSNPLVQLSCAVQPWLDRAYMVAYQDWQYWLENNIVDFVVLMNYSIDRKLTRYLSETAAAINPRSEPSAYIGLGVYLLLNSPAKLYLQIKDCQEIKAKGIVLFSYDAMLKEKDMFKAISENKWWTQ